MSVRATATAHETRTGDNHIIAVVPVPDGFSGPLFIRDQNGTALPTQQRTAMRGPSDVVRTYRLDAVSNSPSGGSRQFTVEDGAVTSGASFQNYIDATLLCEAPNSESNKAVVTFTSRLMQSGANTGTAGDVVRTIIRSGEMQSATGSRLFGWRAHITTYAGYPDIWLVDMSVQNANVGSPGSPLGAAILHDVFFSEIRLSVASPYFITHLHPTPYTTSNKLMASDPGGKNHAIKQGGAKLYRFAICTPSTIARASIFLGRYGFAVCDYSTTLWSWHNPATAWYGPHAKPVPQKDLSSFDPYGPTYATIASKIAQGQSIPFSGSGGPSTPLGPYHVRGPTNGGYSSGDLITPFKGYEVVNTGSVAKLKSHMAILSMDVDRAASSASAGNTGVFICDSTQAPIDPSEWDLSNLLFIADPGKLNSNHQGPWPRLNASQWRLQHASDNNLLPGYYSQLGGYNLYEDSHLIRPLGAMVPLICLLDDPLAKDCLAQFSTWCRAHTLEYGPTDPGAYIGASGLTFSYELSPFNVQTYPHKGAQGGSTISGRIGGWAIFAHCFDWLTTSDDSKRAGAAPWFARIKAHDTLAQLSVGSKNWHAMSDPGDHPVGDLNKQWTANGYPGTPNACASQTIEVGIRAGAMICQHTCTGDADLLAMLASACDGLWAYHHAVGTDSFHFVCPIRPLDNINGAVWATQAEAPDCFTVQGSYPDALDYDNDQVGTLVAAALDYDPAHASAWSIIYAVTGTSTPEAARDALLAIFPAKMEESWGPVVAKLQALTDSPHATPSPARILFGAPIPTVQTALVATPSPAVIQFTSGGPTRAGLAVDPSPAKILLGAPVPDVTCPVEATPSPAKITFLVPLQSATSPDGAEPSPAVIGFDAVSPWDLNAEGIETTLLARLVVSGTRAARQVGGATLLAVQDAPRAVMARQVEVGTQMARGQITATLAKDST